MVTIGHVLTLHAGATEPLCSLSPSLSLQGASLGSLVRVAWDLGLPGMQRGPSCLSKGHRGSAAPWVGRSKHLRGHSSLEGSAFPCFSLTQMPLGASRSKCH